MFFKITLFIYETSRNNQKIVFDGYQYRLNKNTGTKIFWRCIIKTCRRTICTPIEFDLETVLHVRFIYNHGENYVAMTLECVKGNLKRFSTKMNMISTYDIIETVLRGQPQQITNNYGFRTKKTLARRIQRNRNQVFGQIPSIINFFNLPDVFKKTIINKISFQYGPNKPWKNNVLIYNLIVFFTDGSAQLLCENNVWSVDETFSVVPKHFNNY